MPKRDLLITRVTEFLHLVEHRHMWIQTHDIPDPDALASAEALRLIARQFGITARIVSNGLPHRRENNALIKECKIHVRLLDTVRISSPSHYAWVFIDCLPGGGNVTLHQMAPGDIFMAIDHHSKPDPEMKDNPHAYIIADHTVGATSTLLGKLLFRLNTPFPPRLASALSYAIITDTQDFSRGASKDDLNIYSALFPYANQKIISRLRNVTKSRQYFRTMHTTLENAYFYRYVSWVFLGEVASGENVAEIADFILSCERITWSLALGYKYDKLFISIRASQAKSHCARVISRIVRGFRGVVGGHNELAGGFILFDSTEDPGEIAHTVIKRFIRFVIRLPKSADDPVGTPFVD